MPPSSDTASHAYIYRHMPDVYGVVHTHSTYATAWAATGQNIPCGLTMMGDEFGGDVPVGPFRLIGSEAIGEGVVSTYATAWAATGQNIPCGLTMMGDEFGGDVPVGPFRLIGSEAIGEGVV